MERHKKIRQIVMNNWKIIFLLFLITCQGKTSENKISKEANELPSSVFLEEKATLDSTKTAKDSISKQKALVLSKDFLMGKFDAKKHPQFVVVPMEYSVLQIPLFMQKDAYQAFLEMKKAAKKDGLNLNIVSSFRSFYEQKYIWDIKWKKNEDTLDINKAKFILEYSAMPGTSRHHWGTDIDINSVEVEYFEKAEGKLVYQWLKQNAPKYGFFQPYTKIDEKRPTGYFEEKWHWSYQPIAEKCLQAYQEKITFQDFYGFAGANLAQKLNIIEDYVFGIAK